MYHKFSIMETKTASTRMFSLVVLFDMHTKYFHSVLDGISDNDAHNRLQTKANHIAWLAGSLVQQRFEMANLLGIDQKQVAHKLFENNQGIKDNVDYPPLDQFKKDWDRITPGLRNAYMNVTDQKLDSDFEMMPDMKMKIYDLVSFITYREANCIGQIALWRRLLGYDPMKYM